MRTAHYKQSICISETNAELFQEKINAALAQIPDPEIVFDRSQPMTAYIFYTVGKNQPETLLELLEMTDEKTGGRATCEICRHFEKSKDRRKKWGICRKDGEQTRIDSRACEIYYFELRNISADIIEEFRRIPFLIDGTSNK